MATIGSDFGQGDVQRIKEMYENDPAFKEYVQSLAPNIPPADQLLAGFESWKVTDKAEDRFGEITDFQSPLYQKYRQFASQAMPTVGTNALLAPLMAGGGNRAASQVQAGAQRDELGKERSDFLNKSTNQFALGMQSQVNPLLSLMSDNARFQQNFGEQRRQWEASQPDFGDFFLSLAPSAVSAFAPGMSPGSGGGGGGYKGGNF